MIGRVRNVKGRADRTERLFPKQPIATAERWFIMLPVPEVVGLNGLYLSKASIVDLIANVQLIQGLIPAKTRLTGEEIETRLRDRSHCITKVLRGDKLVGLFVWYQDTIDFYHWLGAIKPEFQGHGITTAYLIDVLLNGPIGIWSVRVPPDSRVARIFERLGFQVSGRSPGCLEMRMDHFSRHKIGDHLDVVSGECLACGESNNSLIKPCNKHVWS